MTELLPCPFCGGEAEYMNTGPSMERAVNLDKKYGRCSNRECCASKVYSLVERWNTRTPTEGIFGLPSDEKIKSDLKYVIKNMDFQRLLDKQADTVCLPEGMVMVEREFVDANMQLANWVGSTMLDMNYPDLDLIMSRIENAFEVQALDEAAERKTETVRTLKGAVASGAFSWSKIKDEYDV